MRRGLAILPLILLAASGGEPQAQAPASQDGPTLQAAPASPAGLSDAARAMIGTWEFSNADRDRICTVTFKADPGATGMKIEFDRTCPGVFPFLREIAGWTLAENDFLRLLDGSGRSVLDFSEVESGVYEAPRPGEGILFIQNANAAGPTPVARTAAQIGGDWMIQRGAGKPVCALGLTNTAAGADFVVQVRPPCDPVVTRFGPATWQLDKNEIVLKSARGQTWRFEEGEEPNVYRRVPESAEPILLVRK